MTMTGHRRSIETRRKRDVRMLTDARNRLVESLRRFDFAPNRGIDLAYQPHTPRSVNTPVDDPVLCRLHDSLEVGPKRDRLVGVLTKGTTL